MKTIRQQCATLAAAVGILATVSCYADPWMTGPIIAASGHTLPEGHTNFEPYLFATDNMGFYNHQWHHMDSVKNITINPTMVLTQGLLKRLDVQLIAPYNINHKEGKTDSNVGDMSLILGFQLLEQSPKNWMPDLRITLQEGFPTGKYDNLSLSKNGTDTTGMGSYQTAIGLNFQKMHKFSDAHYLRARLTLIYTRTSDVGVAGPNSYGGGTGTTGTVNPGDKFTADLGLEYTLTQHWVPAIDFSYMGIGATSFRGAVGTASSGAAATVGGPGEEQISIAPAIEYNFSSTMGLIAGVWFTVSGHDANDFVSGVVAFNYYH